MKYNLFFCLFLALSLMTCNENMPEIACLSCDTGTQVITPDDRRVLIEEFSGVKCVNCPQASSLIDELISIHGDRVVAVSMHTGFFSTPYSNSTFDFRTAEGTQILNFLKPPVGYPSAVFNRTQFDSEEDLQIEQISMWSGLVQNELNKPVVGNLSVENSNNTDNRTLEVTAALTPTEDIGDDNIYISVMLTETGIVDVQLTPSGKQTDYTHKHVFRDILTNFSGDPIDEVLEKGVTLNFDYSLTIPEEWNAQNCDVLVFVHRNAGSSKEVLQATHAGVAE